MSGSVSDVAEASGREVSSRTLDDGARVVLYEVVASRAQSLAGKVPTSSAGGDPRWLVEAVGPKGRSPVFLSAFCDEASAVFDAHDGVARDWHAAYLPVGKVPADKARLSVVVHAVGKDVTACAAAFAESKGEGLDARSLCFETDDEPGSEFQWAARFRLASTGTWFKAAGRFVPGGAVMTWWK